MMLNSLVNDRGVPKIVSPEARTILIRQCYRTQGPVDQESGPCNPTEEKNKEGKLPLHMALQKEVTADTAKALASRIESMGKMIDMVIKGYPEACGIKQEGVVPLHIACTNKCPIAAVKALTDTNPDACKIAADGTANLPLHLAALKGASEEVIELLVEVDY